MSNAADQPFFSAITPSWNQGEFLAACIESILAQGDPDFEHIVFDNVSTDETSAVVARYPHLRFISEPDRGQSHAVNKGLAAARGEIICWLNADDEYAPEAFAALRAAFADPSTTVVFGDARQVGYGGADDTVAQGSFAHREDFVRWWSGKVKLHQPSIFFRRSTLEETGLLREDLHYAMDYEFWWRLSKRHRFVHLPRVLSVQHRQPRSKTIVAWRRVLEEREKIFSPYYETIDHGNRPALLREKRRAVAQAYLDQAYAVVEGGKSEALRLLCCAVRERPAILLEGRWLGVLRRVFG